MEDTFAEKFALQFPVCKAIQRPDGVLEFDALASDEGLDIENERIAASGWVDSLQYLTQQGRVGWNHHKVKIGDKWQPIPIGDISEARIVTPQWALEHFGDRLVTAPIGKCVYVKGHLYKPNDNMGTDQLAALELARGTMAGGGALGISLEGGRVDSAPVATGNGGFITQTTRAVCHTAELTPSPMNSRTLALPMRLAKSLSGMVAGEAEESEDVAPDEPMVFVCKGVAYNGEPRLEPEGDYDEASPMGSLVRAVRQGLAAEQEAAILYAELASSLTNPLAIAVFQSIADEERVHAGEFQGLLERLLSDEGDKISEGKKEVDEMANTLTGKQIAKALRATVAAAREEAVTDPVEQEGRVIASGSVRLGGEESGVLELLKGIGRFLLKSYVKPHRRKLASGKTVRVEGYRRKGGREAWPADKPAASAAELGYFPALQYTDTFRSEADAQAALEAQLEQVDSLGGRVTHRDGTWGIQVFSHADPDVDANWMPDGVRKVLVPRNQMKKFGIVREQMEPITNFNDAQINLHDSRTGDDTPATFERAVKRLETETDGGGDVLLENAGNWVIITREDEPTEGGGYNTGYVWWGQGGEHNELGGIQRTAADAIKVASRQLRDLAYREAHATDIKFGPVRPLDKSLTTGDQVVTAGDTGGATIRTQQLAGGTQDTARGSKRAKLAHHLRCMLKAMEEEDWETAQAHRGALEACGLAKGYVRPHTRTTQSGQRVQVAGHTNKRQGARPLSEDEVALLNAQHATSRRVAHLIGRGPKIDPGTPRAALETAIRAAEHEYDHTPGIYDRRGNHTAAGKLASVKKEKAMKQALAEYDRAGGPEPDWA